MPSIVDQSGIGGLGAEIGSITGSLFGTGGSSSGNTTQSASSEQSSKLVLEEEAINKLIKDVLGSSQGLANIFTSEAVAGLYDSSVGKQASGDLVANLIGELAKLTGRTETKRSDTSESTTSSNTETKGLFDFLGF